MATKMTYKVCCCFRRRFKITDVEPPAGIKMLFGEYSEYAYMDVEHLLTFLRKVQKDDEANKETAKKIIDSARELKHIPNNSKGLNLNAFFRYLLSDNNPPLRSKGVHHDMTAPLSHYFIFTGHNSYLTGNQLSSDCSDVPIIQALQNGVRVIELDIWPNPDKDDVDVLHGGTLTAPVKLITCLQSIKEHAFTASEYPVVITLEDHLNAELQAKVAEMVNKTFGDILFTPGPEGLKDFPSPEKLKRRIIISTKPPKEYLNAQDVSGEQASTHDSKDDREDEAEDEHDCFKSHHPEYKHLIAMQAGKGSGGMTEWLTDDPDRVRRLSLSEPELEGAVLTHRREIVRFTQRNILRVYPKGIRVDSSNYDPFLSWRHGAQMVAFNMQGYGKQLWLMQGMFRANGGCGYVKKPNFLLNTSEVYDPRDQVPYKIVLKVTVYMGEGWYSDFSPTDFDTYSPPDFYARVGIAGAPIDTIMRKTKAIEDNWAPFWNEEFEFPLTVPELALLRVEVHEYDVSEQDDFGGQTCLLIPELRSGIRAVPLHSYKGERFNNVRLLMGFHFS